MRYRLMKSEPDVYSIAHDGRTTCEEIRNDQARKFLCEDARVGVRGLRADVRFVSLDALKAEPRLEGTCVIHKGMRLSVQPVEPHHFAAVLESAGFPL
jgi:predicted RNA-binding protein with PUA-like domain